MVLISRPGFQGLVLISRPDVRVFGLKLEFFMAALRSRCGHYIFALWFLSIFYLFFVPRLISGLGLKLEFFSKVLFLITRLLIDRFIEFKFYICTLHRHVLPSQSAPFPQIDIIGAMLIVWRVGGQIIRSVLCNIVRNNCAQCDAHTYEQT